MTILAIHSLLYYVLLCMYHRSYKPLNWGSKHPDYKSGAARIKFSKEENKYIISLIKLNCVLDNEGNYKPPPKFASFCLEQIKMDNLAIPIFHERHVLSTERIRSILRRWKLVK